MLNHVTYANAHAKEVNGLEELEGFVLHVEGLCEDQAN